MAPSATVNAMTVETHWIPITKLWAMIAAGQFTNVNLLAALNIFFAQLPVAPYQY